ncbi:MBL fold metallo-hydrolase [Candidatus Fermentibacteria bacterium]|nr:MBL fold metallo-hydrolase [Candidatus Fermentibacteria bacterium]
MAQWWLRTIRCLIVTECALAAPTVHGGEFEMTVLYDNYVSTPGTTADWGFSCLIEGMERTILFDTGADGDLLLRNAQALKKDLSKVDLVVLSHNHRDHTGGLRRVLGVNHDMSVYFGHSYPGSFAKGIAAAGATPIPVDTSIALCRNVYSTGEIRGTVNEQALVLDTDQGLVVITGCSHPGIVSMLRAAQAVMHKPIHMVYGGFHLRSHSEAQVKEIIREFRELGVEKVGPTHCTGDQAIALFKQEFGSDFLRMGVGRVVAVRDTPQMMQHE